MSIRQRLALIILAISIPMLLLSAATGWQLADQTRDRSRQAIVDASRPVMNAVDAQLGKYITAVQALAVSPSLRTLNYESFRQEAEQALPNLPGVWLTLADAQGKELVNTLLSAADPQPQLSRREAADAPLEAKRIQVSNLITVPTISSPMISVALPLDVGTTTRLLLAVNVDPIVFRGLLNTQGLPEGWLAELIDRDGTIVSRSRGHEEWVGKPAFVRRPPKQSDDPPLEAFDPEDGAVVYASAISPVSGWSTVIAVRKAMVDAPIRRVIENTLLIGILATILSVLLAGLTARSITGPIRALEKGAQALRDHEPALFSATGVPEVDRALQVFESASKSLLRYEAERSQAEAALKSSEARLRLFIEQAPASIAMFDRSMHCLTASHRFLLPQGTHGREIAGQSRHELLLDLDERWEKHHQCALAGQILSGDDEEFVRADGLVQWISWEIQPWRTPDGEVGGTVLFTEDVSSRHEAMKALNEALEALKQSEERLRLLIEGAKDYAIFMLDTSGRVMSWNDGARRTTGYDSDDVIGRDLSLFFTPADIEAGTPRRILEEATSSGAIRHEGEGVKKGGERIWVSSLINPLSSENLKLKGFAIIIRDITDHKIADQALKTSETLLRAVVDGSPDAIIAINSVGIIQSINSNGIKMFGYERQELVGANVEVLVPEHYGNHDAHLQKYAESGKTGILNVSREVEGRRKEGSIFPLGLFVSQTTYADKPLFVGFLRDLSSRRETEARVKQLQGERLSAMGGLAAGLAHELNQPLAAAVTFLETAEILLEMAPERRPSSLNGALSSAINEIMRAGQIMKRLRQFVTTGEPDKTFVSLHELFSDPSVFMLPKKQQIQIDLALNATNDSILADKVQIKQVLNNLIKNATEAMSRSSEKRLRIATTLTEHEMIRVDVSDTGCGLSPAVLKNLFEPFQTTKASGIGIGLSISRLIIEAHYGKIWAAAGSDGGTVFSITLPLQNAELV